MQVKLYGLIRQAAGIKMIDVVVNPSSTIRDVLVEVTQRYPVVVKYIWKEPGTLSELAHVFVNSENILHLDGLNTLIRSDDHVDIFPPVIGGNLDQINTC